MTSTNYAKLIPTLPPTHFTTGLSNLQTHASTLTTILQNKKLPPSPLSPHMIKLLLYELSSMDTNNSTNNLGVGEREGRIFSSIVRDRHYCFAHGVGRSGDLQEQQPKAVGSSIMCYLAKLLVVDALKVMGADFLSNKIASRPSKKGGDQSRNPKNKAQLPPTPVESESLPNNSTTITNPSDLLILPLCTGMSMSLILSTLKQKSKKTLTKILSNPANETKKNYGLSCQTHEYKSIVLWSRIDQKSCLKSIQTSNLTPLPIPMKKTGDSVHADLHALNEMIESVGKDKILCLLTTTSCFAPRLPDPIYVISEICGKLGLPHVINNAYGLQDPLTMKEIAKTVRKGHRIDAIISSLDKNFQVPVGGCLVYNGGGDETVLQMSEIARNYPGRASGSHILDIVVTLLELGDAGVKAMITSREGFIDDFRQGFREVASKFDERLMDNYDAIDIGNGVACLGNRVSFGLTLSTLTNQESGDLGAMLFTRQVSGCRVITPSPEIKTIALVDFEGWGSSCSDFGVGYLTAACSVGIRREEFEVFFERLERCLNEVLKKRGKKKVSKKEIGEDMNDVEGEVEVAPKQIEGLLS